MPMFVRCGFDSRGFDSVPRLVRAAASQQGQMRKTPIETEWLLLGGLPTWRVRSDVTTLWLPTSLTECID